MDKELKDALTTFGLLNNIVVEPINDIRKLIKLSKMESGTILHALIVFANSCGGIDHQPQWFYDLYERLAAVNDKL